MNSKNVCGVCKLNSLILVKKFIKKNKGENLFGLENKKNYKRLLYKCTCGHYYNIHNYNKYLSNVYKKNYSNYSHVNLDKKFNKIISLGNKSSNFQRTKFLRNKIKKNFVILDVGSGFGIFPFKMSNLGYRIDCIESDRNMSDFIKKKNLNLVSTNLLKVKNIKKKYDLITFNKVLEHFELKNIVKILFCYKKLLKKNGKIYIELPDSKAASRSINRQEFFLEHYNIFSKKSFIILMKQIGFKINYLKNIYEINGKFTLRAIINE